MTLPVLQGRLADALFEGADKIRHLGKSYLQRNVSHALFRVEQAFAGFSQPERIQVIMNFFACFSMKFPRDIAA